MQKPILLGVEGQAQEIIEKYRAGLCFEPENEKDFILKVRLLKNDQILYENCQEGSKYLAQEYDRRKLANNMLKIIEKQIIIDNRG